MVAIWFQLGCIPRNAWIHVRCSVGAIALIVAATSAPLPVVAASAISTVPATIGSMIPIENATNIKAQPLAVLAKFPEAGPAMARYVAQLLVDNPSVIDALLSIVSDASPQQAAALGAGLVRGVRALEAKESGGSQSIAEKIIRSENRWLKTTFQALGPSYSANTAGTVILPPVPPPVLNTASVGTTIQGSRARLGETRRFGPPLGDVRGSTEKKFGAAAALPPTAPFDTEVLTTRGMIVANLVNTLKADAPASGAVSTSP